MTDGEWVTVPAGTFYRLNVVAEAVRSLLHNDEISDEDFRTVTTFALGTALMDLDVEKEKHTA